jgi:hypothetical protein
MEGIPLGGTETEAKNRWLWSRGGRAEKKERAGRRDTGGEGAEGVTARGIFAAGGGKGGRNSGGLQSSETEQRQRRKRKGNFPRTCL